MSAATLTVLPSTAPVPVSPIRTLRPTRPANPRVSVIVPAKNEADNIAEILPYLADYHEVIVIVSEDDHASAEAARTALPTATVTRQTRKGKGNAMICGFEQATGDIIVTFDIDGSADPFEIPRFVKALTDGADLAKGSRFTAGGGSEDITVIRGLGNWGLNLIAGILTKTRFTDLCYGFNAFWADQLPRLELPTAANTDASTAMRRGDGFEIEAMIIGRFALANTTIAEVHSFEHHRYHGNTNLSAIKDGCRVLWTLLIDRLHARRYRTRTTTATATITVTAPRRPTWMDTPALAPLPQAA